MPKNEPVQKTADADNQLASQKRTDFGVNANLADVQGAPPCNTAPPKYNQTRILRTGIDSLYLSFFGPLCRERLSQLDQLKALAAGEQSSSKAQAVLLLADVVFTVHAKGRGLHTFVISNKQFQMRIAGKNGRNIPQLYMQISSELLTLHGYEDSLDIANRFAQLLFEQIPKTLISRADLCTDFITLLDWQSIDPARWICRSQRRSEYHENNQLLGFVFGQGGDLVARLYDKTKEIEVTSKGFFRDVWAESGWNKRDTVWRLEVQLRQASLKSALAIEPNLFPERLNSLWRYFTNEWLSLRDPNVADTNRSRWPVNHDWKTLCTAQFNLSSTDRIKLIRYENVPEDESIIIGAVGYLTSFMAKNGIHSLSDALANFLPAAKHHFEFSGSRESLYTYVQRKYRDKCTKFARLIDETEVE